MTNTLTQHNDEASPEMDELLHDYFQGEMPRPWPTFKAPKPRRMKVPASFWAQSSGRLALAACVALLVGGYLTLGGFFPRSQPSSGLRKATEDLGSREKKRRPKTTEKQAVEPMPMPTPMGNKTTK
jgi:hypothetical protein